LLLLSPARYYLLQHKNLSTITRLGFVLYTSARKLPCPSYLRIYFELPGPFRSPKMLGGSEDASADSTRKYGKRAPAGTTTQWGLINGPHVCGTDYARTWKSADPPHDPTPQLVPRQRPRHVNQSLIGGTRETLS
jgi:hypothetical protein